MELQTCEQLLAKVKLQRAEELENGEELHSYCRSSVGEGPTSLMVGGFNIGFQCCLGEDFWKFIIKIVSEGDLKMSHCKTLVCCEHQVKLNQ